ncbi:hypothetical protein [Photobacterium rosenbergii]|uniref:Zinc ribbon domain-containing protein n=1 Tax=Photobacterium rosenbergii TaxID=294936 RepID=A0ABU3ZFI1_9GAMM|nr:hypothetical protein [Photobacterium rosenbergii]MDV5168874.1 hypothetical protein [Photobacterium rosenbergii]
MSKTCIACKEPINESAFKCKNCSSFQLGKFWVQPVLFAIGVTSLVAPLIVIAINAALALQSPDLDIYVLSANGSKREVVISATNNSQQDAIVYYAQFEQINSTYPIANIEPEVVKANSVKTIKLKFNADIGKALNFSAFRVIDDHFISPDSKEDKLWGDNETCTIYVVVHERKPTGKEVKFPCVK